MAKKKPGLWYKLSTSGKQNLQHDIDEVLQKVDALVNWLLGPVENRLEKVTVAYDDRTVEIDFEGIREK